LKVKKHKLKIELSELEINKMEDYLFTSYIKRKTKTIHRKTVRRIWIKIVNSIPD